ncbi:MAG TPA: acyl carrier protein [Actinomycetota bacterium]|nr:acyl carrier protein [Actinomycetota bacterium]
MNGSPRDGNGIDLRSLMRELIVEVCDVAPERIHEDSTLDQLGIDSLSVAELVVELEMRLQRELPTAVLRRLEDVRTFAEMAQALQAALGPDAVVSGGPP